jgi:hypothetical protein
MVIPGKPPLYVAVYVDDFIFFSLDDDVEQYFQTALSQKLQVEFLGDAEWFLRMKFDWSSSSDGAVHCRISQEGYAATIAHEMGLSAANISPQMTPFRSGFPIDTIPHVDMSPEARAPLIAKMQSWLGMISWLQMCTCHDLATMFMLLSTHMHKPSPGHLEAVKYLGRYIHSTMELGLHFTSTPTPSLEFFVHFPLDPGSTSTSTTTSSPSLHTFCDANWAPQDASRPSPTNMRQVSIEETNLSVVTYFSWGVALSFGKHTKNPVSAVAPARRKSKLLMNVLNRLKCFITS